MSAFRRVFVALTGLFLTATSASALSSIPQYRFAVGERLGYEAEYEFLYDKYPDAAHGDHIKTTIWVLEQRDNAWTILLSRVDTSFSVLKSETSERDPSTALVLFTLAQDGHITTDRATAEYCSDMGIRLEEYFPRLPASPDQMRDGWSSHDPRLRRSYRYRLPAATTSNTNEIEIDVEAIDPMDPIVAATQREQVRFDVKAGRLARMTSVYRQEYGHLGTGTLSVELASQDRVDLIELNRLMQASRRFSTARADSSTAWRSLRSATSRAAAEQAYAEAQTALEAAKRDLTQPAF